MFSLFGRTAAHKKRPHRTAARHFLICGGLLMAFCVIGAARYFLLCEFCSIAKSVLYDDTYNYGKFRLCEFFLT